jgi:hypothetical protein
MNDKLDSWPLDASLSPKSGKSRLNLHGTILEGKSIDSDPQKKKDLKCKLMIWRTKMKARVQLKVKLKDSIELD